MPRVEQHGRGLATTREISRAGGTGLRGCIPGSGNRRRRAVGEARPLIGSPPAGRIAAAVLPALDDWVAVRSMGKDEAATRRLIDVLQARIRIRGGSGCGMPGPQGLAGFGQSRERPRIWTGSRRPPCLSYLRRSARTAKYLEQDLSTTAGSVEIPGRLLDQLSLGCGPDLAAVPELIPGRNWVYAGSHCSSTGERRCHHEPGQRPR